LKASRYIRLFLLQHAALFSLSVAAQDGTRNTSTTPENAIGKIMIVPFEPKLYLSEIDKKINAQTKWDFNQIRENFRHQLDKHLQLKFSNYSSVISFYTDSAKMSKDLKYVYGATSISFDPLDKPNSINSLPAAKTSGIKDGQVAVEMSSEKKFTNIILNDRQALLYLNKKYQAAYFVFVNQLDIKNDADSYNITTNSYQRRLDVHYTILDKNGKLIAAGIASSVFSSKENNPKKIVASSFSPAADYIATKFMSVVKPSPVLPKK
jgi:hypothetical protein